MRQTKRLAEILARVILDPECPPEVVFTQCLKDGYIPLMAEIAKHNMLPKDETLAIAMLFHWHQFFSDLPNGKGLWVFLRTETAPRNPAVHVPLRTDAPVMGANKSPSHKR